MAVNSRHYTLIDKLIERFDQSLRTLNHTDLVATRTSPAASIAEKPLTTQEQKHSAGLLRVDHAGEICAQALYQGQALTARTNTVREKMQQSALEENDHLAWCQERLRELNNHPSYLNPFWYFGSFIFGVIAGTIGDKWSLGFVAETEKQVVQHLEKHLKELPLADEKSRKILTQMCEDEQHHATVAIETGAAELPSQIKQLMRLMSKIMTTTAYWI